MTFSGRRHQAPTYGLRAPTAMWAPWERGHRDPILDPCTAVCQAPAHLSTLLCPESSDHAPQGRRRAVAGVERLEYAEAPSRFDQGTDVSTALRGRPHCWQCLLVRLSLWELPEEGEELPTFILHPPYGWRQTLETASMPPGAAPPPITKRVLYWCGFPDVWCQAPRHKLPNGSWRGRPARAPVRVWLGDDAAARALGVVAGEDLGPLCWACIAAVWPAVVLAEGTLRVRACLPEDRSWEDPLRPPSGG